MTVEFARPLALGAIPLCLALIWFIGRGRPSGIKTKAAAITRAALITLVVIALAAPSVLLPGGGRAVWVLIDGSDSAAPLSDEQYQELSMGLENAPDDVSVGVISYARTAMVELGLSKGRLGLSGGLSVPGDDTRLSDALSLASALLPDDMSGRVVVMGDGRADDISLQAGLLAARGVKADVLKLDAGQVPDAQVSELILPSDAREGQELEIRVVIHSNMDTTGTIVLYQNREVASTRDVRLRAGENRFVFRDAAKASGAVTYEARLVAEGDEQPRNDSKSAFVRVGGRANALLVEGKPGQARELEKMLEAALFNTETISPARLPADASSLRQYEAVVLVNVDASDMALSAIDAISSAVRQLGRGLVVVGGDASYALGGYRGSPIEELLPVTIDVRSDLDMPSLALVLVIDKSGSMTEGRYGITRLEMAKEAAMRSTQVLTENDFVGVIAFDDTAKWVAPLEPVEDAGRVQSMIGTIRPGGGTAFYAPLNEAYQALLACDAAQKHVIFLSDGDPADKGFDGIAQAMSSDGITLTTVGVGTGANAQLLTSLALSGGGRAYIAGEFDDLPKIFAKETYLASGAYVRNRVFTPAITEDGILTRFDGFPRLNGYLATTAREVASVSLVSDLDEPILAHWRYGAGTVLCWTSDALGAWTGEFLNWDDAAKFFSGLVSFASPSEEQSGSLTARADDGYINIVYEMPPDANDEGITTTVEAMLPDGEARTVELRETSPGAYEGALETAGEGAYALRAVQSRQGEVLRSFEGGVVVSYSREYDMRQSLDNGSFEQLANVTGGRVLTDAREMFTAEGTDVRTRRDLTQAFIWAALCLFLIDIAMRRLNWERALEKLKTRERRDEPARPKPARAAVKTDKPAPTATADKLLELRDGKKKL